MVKISLYISVFGFPSEESLENSVRDHIKTPPFLVAERIAPQLPPQVLALTDYKNGSGFARRVLDEGDSYLVLDSPIKRTRPLFNLPGYDQSGSFYWIKLWLPERTVQAPLVDYILSTPQIGYTLRAREMGQEENEFLFVKTHSPSASVLSSTVENMTRHLNLPSGYHNGVRPVDQYDIIKEILPEPDELLVEPASQKEDTHD